MLTESNLGGLTSRFSVEAVVDFIDSVFAHILQFDSYSVSFVDFLKFVSSQIKQRNKVIVENCNVTKSKRMELLDCAFKPANAVCIHFDVDIKECKRRASARRGHETKKLFDSSRGFKIIDSFAKQLERPDIKEGFKQVIVVRNNGDIDRVLSRLGVRKSIETLFDDAEHDDADPECRQIVRRRASGGATEDLDTHPECRRFNRHGGGRPAGHVDWQLVGYAWL